MKTAVKTKKRPGVANVEQVSGKIIISWWK